MRLCIVTGEASGDLHAAAVARELRQLDPSLELFGLGATRLKAEGMEILHDVREMALVGLFNVVRHLPMLFRVFRKLVREIRLRRPDAVLLVDYPDFNLRLAAECRKLGIPVIYYISPQVWAWRKSRIHRIARLVDHMIVVFPFEERYYQERGIRVSYVGHPLVEQLAGFQKKEAPGVDRPVRLALMPGSRRMEIDTLLPPMIDAVRLLRESRAVDPYIIKAPTISRTQLDRILNAKGEKEIRLLEDEGRLELAQADLTIASSGTATLEAAVLGVPLIVLYRLGAMTYLVARQLVKLPHFSLVNIVAGEEVVPELLQGEVTGRNIAGEAARILQPAVYAAMCRKLELLRARLGQAGASARAAALIHEDVSSWRGAEK